MEISKTLLDLRLWRAKKTGEIKNLIYVSAKIIEALNVFFSEALKKENAELRDLEARIDAETKK